MNILSFCSSELPLLLLEADVAQEKIEQHPSNEELETLKLGRSREALLLNRSVSIRDGDSPRCLRRFSGSQTAILEAIETDPAARNLFLGITFASDTAVTTSSALITNISESARSSRYELIDDKWGSTGNLIITACGFPVRPFISVREAWIEFPQRSLDRHFATALHDEETFEQPCFDR